MKIWMLAALFSLMLVFGCICGGLNGGEILPQGNNSGEPEGDSGQLPEEASDSGEDAAQEPEDGGPEAQEEPEEDEGGESGGAGQEREVDYVECVDTDGGDDKYAFGKISRVTYYTDGTFEEEELFSDECVGNKLVREYVCRENGKYRKVEWTCEKCENGACVE